jgi:uncharacterized protein (TIGR02147 family)
MLQKLCMKLNLDPKEASLYAGFGNTKKAISGQNDFRPIDFDQFHLIAEWHHYAILELMRVEGFKSDRRWIAKTLGIAVVEVNAAIERLVRTGLLKVEGDRWQAREEKTTTVKHPYTTVAHRKLQEQFLMKAITALNEVPMEHRHQSGVTMAIDAGRLKDAAELTARYRRDMTQLLSRSGNCEKVYQLSISLYPLSAIH